MKERIKELVVVFLSIAFVRYLADTGWLTAQSGWLPDTRGARIGLLAVAASIGFGIGWLISPEAREFRRLASIGLVTILVGSAVVDQGGVGWTATTVSAVILFSAGIGYGLREIAREFFSTTTTFGSADWANDAHMIEHQVIGYEGFQLGRVTIGGKWVPVKYDRDRHLLTVAPTRSGKGTTAIIPNLLLYPGSALIIDPKGENAMITARRRASMGQKIFVVDPWGITTKAGLRSARFNPLDWLRKGDIDITENAMLLADALVVGHGEQEHFWVEEAKALLQGLILHVATAKAEEGQRHLGRVRDLLLLDGEDMPKLFQLMTESEHLVVASTGARCLQKEEKLLANVIASAQAQTHFLDSLRIRESLSASDFRFEDLKREKMTIYLVLPSDRLNAFGRWLRLLIQQAITVNARNIGEKPDKPVLILLDEMPALGRLTMVEQAYGLMAGYGIQLWGIVQDLTQLKRIYGESWETFIGNSGVLQYFGSRDRTTAEYFSTLCGVKTVWTLSSAVSRSFSSGNGSSSNGSSSSETTSATQRKLVFADELMRLPADKQLILIENLRPISARKVAWFEDPQLQVLGQPIPAQDAA